MPGLPFVAFALPLVGVAAGACWMFNGVSMTHFNTVVILGFAITGHMAKELLFPYVASKVIGAPGKALLQGQS